MDRAKTFFTVKLAQKPVCIGLGVALGLVLLLGLWLLVRDDKPTPLPAPAPQAPAVTEYSNTDLGLKFTYPSTWGTASLKTYAAVAKGDKPANPYYQVVFATEPRVTVTMPNKNAEVTFQTLGRNEKKGYASYAFDYKKKDTGTYCAVFPVIEDCVEWDGVLKTTEVNQNGVRSPVHHYISTVSEWPYLQGFHPNSPFATALQQGQKYQMYEVVSVFNPTAPEYRSLMLEVLGEENANFQTYIQQINQLVPTIQKL